jgi:hypothetical protein
MKHLLSLRSFSQIGICCYLKGAITDSISFETIICIRYFSVFSSDNAVFHDDNIDGYYSSLTDEQRKNCFRKMMEINTKLSEELKEIKLVRNEQIKESHDIEGEEEAMPNNNQMTCFTLYPERVYKDCSSAQMHFRLAGLYMFTFNTRQRFRIRI